MILKGSQRSGGQQLGHHLLKTEENEHVEIHEIRGFVSDSVLGAMKEAQALSQGTRCKQYLFSLSLSPPQNESVASEVFEGALDKIEERLGLTGQPRIVVFHEKEGRRHAHAVWSRIDADTMTAKQLSFFKSKLREVSKELYLENGWQMPRGLIDSKVADPTNYTLAEWQQAKRREDDPKALKGIIQECYAASDGSKAFAHALEERGLFLAKGDRRGFVAVTYQGTVLSIARELGRPAKEIRTRLGDPDGLASVEETKTHIAEKVAPRLSNLIREAKNIAARSMQPLRERQAEMARQHREERQRLDEGQKSRWLAETRTRSERIRHGFASLWDRLSGEQSRMKAKNELEAIWALQRDRKQRDDLVRAQLAERRELQKQIMETRTRNAQRVLNLYRDAAVQQRQRSARMVEARRDFTRSAEPPRPRRPTRGPGLER